MFDVSYERDFEANPLDLLQPRDISGSLAIADSGAYSVLWFYGCVSHEIFSCASLHVLPDLIH